MMADESNVKLGSAIRSGLLDNVRNAFDAGANADEKFEDGMTPLQLAVVLGYSDIVELLLDKQAQINTLNRENESALNLAVRNANVNIVKLLLDRGANVNPRLLDNTLTPLEEACKSCNHRIVKLLLDKGANINARLGYEDTPLHIAISNEEDANDPYCSMMLIEHGADGNAYNRQNETPLSLAAKRGSVSLVKEILLRGPCNGDLEALKGAISFRGQNYADIVDYLIDYGVSFNPYEHRENVKSLEESAKNGHYSAVRSLLHKDCINGNVRRHAESIMKHALANKDLKMLKLLLGYSPSKECCAGMFVTSAKEAWIDGCRSLIDHCGVNATNYLGETALHCAKSREIAEFLLDKGADLCAATKQGLLPLHTAVKNDYKEVVSTLLSRRARSPKTGEEISVANQCDKLGKTPLHYAVSKDMAQLLVDNGAQLDVGDQGYLPLHAAAQKGQEEVVSTLLRSGANVNASTNYGMTPLHYAARRGNISIVHELMRYGAEIDSVRECGFTPLCDAIMANNLDIAEVLLNSGANVGVKIQSHSTPLHYAAKNGLTEMVECLLRYGIDINIEDDSGKTALHVVAENGKCDVVLLLLDAGAGVNIKCKQGKTPLVYAKSFVVSSPCGAINNQRMIEAIESKNKSKLPTFLE